MSFFLRIVTLLLFCAWQLYWMFTENKSDKEKPKTQKSTFKNHIGRLFIIVQGIIIFLQLLKTITILPIYHNPWIQLTGFIIVITGVGVSVSARISLGANWSHAVDYQIKHNHELVTKDIYQYIRNPIYVGLTLSFVGAELVTESYLFIAAFIINGYISYLQSKREEKILSEYFGKKYEEYKKRTKMLIPFVF